jgi:hypothetical protein
MTDKEVMQMAMDIMESAIKAGDWVVDGACDPDWVLNALRAALAQPEPEPVAWKMKGVPAFATSRPNDTDSIKWDALYTAPLQRERVQFPTMLRKMWSGSEVQAWLDENVN